MGNYMKAYTIAFENNNGTQVASRDIITFFKRIENVLNNNTVKVVRRINGKIMRVHAYEWPAEKKDYVVVPIGKLKEKNKPFASDPQTQKLVEFTEDMFDVNSIAYHKRYNIMLLTTNSAGPNDNDVEAYLNSYLPCDAQYRLRLRPIVRNIALEKIRNAQEARSVTISLNVGRPLNDFLVEKVNHEKGIQNHLKALMEFSKSTLESNTFTLTLGLGRKRKATLDIGALIDLIDSINLDANCINEIAVNYRNAPDEKIDVAKLKDSTAGLNISFDIKESQLGAEYILNNLEEKLLNERVKFYQQVERYFSEKTEIGEEYEFVETFEEVTEG